MLREAYQLLVKGLLTFKIDIFIMGKLKIVVFRDSLKFSVAAVAPSLINIKIL